MTVETAILFTFVIAAFVALAIYLQRGAQGGVKSNADSLGIQFSATQGWESKTKSNTKEDQVEIVTKQDSDYSQTLTE